MSCVERHPPTSPTTVKHGGETKSKNRSSTTAFFEKLPQYMRLQVFHFLTYVDYFITSRTCKSFKNDLDFSAKYNILPQCLFIPSTACKTLNEAVIKVSESQYRPCIADHLTVGTSVRARLNSGGTAAFYSCKINSINENGLYNVVFDNGRSRWNTPLDEMTMSQKKKNCLTTIILGRGNYIVEENKTNIDLVSFPHGKKRNYLIIDCPLNIVGAPNVDKKDIIILGGIIINKNIEEKIHIENLTMRQSMGNGVDGESSFSLKDLCIEQCDLNGVVARGSSTVARCTNVIICQCKRSGVIVEDSSMTLVGRKTSVHHNCTHGAFNDYGLNAWTTSSTIQLISPLKKETVSKDNYGGHNWKELNIETIAEEEKEEKEVNI